MILAWIFIACGTVFKVMAWHLTRLAIKKESAREGNPFMKDLFNLSTKCQVIYWVIIFTLFIASPILLELSGQWIPLLVISLAWFVLNLADMIWDVHIFLILKDSINGMERSIKDAPDEGNR